jgi:hypothetical protein
MIDDLRLASPSSPHESRRGRLLGGGTEGNERLTVLAGLLLIVLFAALGVTIVAIGRLLWLHLFLGLLLLGPVALKLASTGYRFMRYYTSNPAYRAKGPPLPLLRGLAPTVVFFTVAVFGTGVMLLLIGPSSRSSLGELHKLTFIAWILVTAVHVLGHVPETVHTLFGAAATRRELLASREARPSRGRSHRPTTAPSLAGREGRGAALVISLLGGAALAIALIGQYTVWTH